jgi:hypothetical protein
MKELAEKEERDFLEHFGRFEDAVVDEVRLSLSYGPTAGLPTADLILSVRSALTAAWVKVHLRLAGVAEYAIRHPYDRMTPTVLSDGLTLVRVDGLLFLDFAPHVVHLEGRPTVDELRASRLYFACQSCGWEYA